MNLKLDEAKLAMRKVVIEADIKHGLLYRFS